MEPQPNDLKAIRFLFFAMLASQMIFALIATVLVETGIFTTGMGSLTTIFQVAVVVLAVTTISASLILFRKRLADIGAEEPLQTKLEKYRAALILRMALCEGPAMFCTLAYLATNNRSFLWINILLIINFLLIYPSREKIINQLQLSSSEQSALGID